MKVKRNYIVNKYHHVVGFECFKNGSWVIVEGLCLKRAKDIKEFIEIVRGLKERL
jgi:hypothetical protein